MAYMVSLRSTDKYIPDSWFSPDEKEQYRILYEQEVWIHFLKCTAVPPEQLDELPKQMHVAPIRGFWPDVFPCSGAVTWAVSPEFKALVEQLEPNVHDFFPLELLNRKGEPWSKTYYLLLVRTQLSNFVDLEHSIGIDVLHETLNLPDGSQKPLRTLRWNARTSDKLVLRKGVTKGHHLWKGGIGEFISRHFISEKLLQLLTAQGLTKLWITHAEEL